MIHQIFRLKMAPTANLDLEVLEDDCSEPLVVGVCVHGSEVRQLNTTLDLADVEELIEFLQRCRVAIIQHNHDNNLNETV